ncbi:FAD-binding and (Fe-S)-binding domain-containing protein [Haloarcula onubensis]|uniref:D-lactate dehydrogenase (cytochrome) n=1 Tax=Haloarcula onubensis TaxID=2950539 RepID=A0ABU2FV08_9EURY|nr:FAD-linked oxidase C-terminal domain-containing protein [Halomicroarcula sp. S3CR25-11]MDS0284092.1 FAD-binding protein [Halomicroarcula sp. S3CR25-11]
MGATEQEASEDPAADGRADYDYQGDGVARPAMVAELRERVEGDVRFDEYSRQLYATDASAYEMTPVGVVYPTSTADVAAVVRYCASREIPVLPRGGGTSLAGQSVNEAVVLDFTRHMDDLESVDAEDRRATAQVGVRLGDLNAALAPEGLKFAPDPAWGDKSALGGAIGNNSTGAHSLQYGKTDHYVESCEVVLADGTVTTFGESSLAQLRAAGDPDGDLESRVYDAVVRLVEDGAEAIEGSYPHLKRNVSGYNLDRLLAEARGEYGEEGTVNLARLLAGSEGTLAIVTEATVSLEPVPETKALALLTYDDLVTAMRDVEPILAHDPAAVEVLDDVLLDLAGETEAFGALVDDIVPDGTGAILLVEFYAEDDQAGKRKVADLLADRIGDVDTAVAPGETAAGVTDEPTYAFLGREAHSDAERERFWKLRKSGLPILLGRTSDAKHISFIEDTAVPPENLPEYVADFRDLLDEQGTFASFYAHAGPGCLHIRPLVDTKTVDGVERMEAIADGATELVTEYGGSVSGEHGDGRARTQWNHRLYGDDVWELFQELKTAFDPDWLLNPGQVVGVDENDVAAGRAPLRARTVDMTENLRFDPDYDFEPGFESTLDWPDENGMQGMVELCHGCGGCRGPQETTGGVMCPTYRAAEEESTSTRGRANMLRQAMSGDLPDDPTDSEFVSEVMDLCIGCKGCARDCPSEVDMAKLKAEVEHAHHQDHGATLRDRLFANVETVSRVGSALAPVSNWAAKLPGSGYLGEKLLGIARERPFPTFRRESFADWWADRGPTVPEARATRRALLFPDTYDNYSDPDVLRAAVTVLEAAGVHVQVPDDIGPSGRAAHSKGFLDAARDRAATNVDALAPRVADGWDVVVVEPSDAVMLQSDYLDLLGHDDEAATALAASAFGVCEYLDRFALDAEIAWAAPETSLTYHGHCHQKAVTKDHHAVGVLRRAGYAVDPLDSGCCGMAGSFGYEAEHYSMSAAIGEILFEQVRSSDGADVVAPGASCRTQLADGPTDGPVPHPVQKLADAVGIDDE